MQFVKMHGAGNDFVVIDARETKRDWPDLAVAMCDRHFGVGGDGLLLIEESDQAPFRMRMFNPDGSEAEMCGNGIRCFAKYVVDNGIWKGEDEFAIETLAGVKGIQVVRNEDGSVGKVRVSMGAPEFRPELIPVKVGPDGWSGGDRVVDWPVPVDGRTIRVNGVSMGNPHAVAFVEEPVDQFPLQTLGPLVEHHPYFPRRVNFEIVNILGRDRLKMRVWERGAGETLACGSGASAVAAVARSLGPTDAKVTLELDGGVLELEWDGTGEVLMTGPAELVFSGDWRR